MSNENVLVQEEMEDDVEALYDSILFLEERELLDIETADECLYHLQRLTSILDLDVDIDRLNDKDLAKDDTESETVLGFVTQEPNQDDLDERVAGFVIDDEE